MATPRNKAETIISYHRELPEEQRKAMSDRLKLARIEVYDDWRE